MQKFRLNKDIDIIAEHQNTRSGFRHVATLMYKGRGVEETKATYLNRTWEAYEFQSVVLKLISISTYLTKRQKTIHTKKFRGRVW